MQYQCNLGKFEAGDGELEHQVAITTEMDKDCGYGLCLPTSKDNTNGHYRLSRHVHTIEVALPLVQLVDHDPEIQACCRLPIIQRYSNDS